ncbi:phosphatidylserine decarboxylase family protein, partial [Streptomyces sp. NPDC048512]
MPAPFVAPATASLRLARGASPWLLPTVATAALSLARSRRSGAAR